MRTMLFIFSTGMDPCQTADAIKNTVLHMGGTVNGTDTNMRCKFRIPKGWKPKYSTLFPSTFHFYIGAKGVRAVLQLEMGSTAGYCVGEHSPYQQERVWDAFLRMFIGLYPNSGIDIEPGTIRIKEIEIIDGPDIKTYTTVTRNAPSISGAILGGAIAGEAGALVGAATGGSRSYTSERVERNSKVQIKARYTNGHYQETELEKASQRYHEIMVNF